MVEATNIKSLEGGMVIQYWCDSERSLGGGETNWTLRKECNRQMRRRIVGKKRVLEGGIGGKTEANIFTTHTGLGWSVSGVE